jgi:hypothetical protein
LKFNNFENGNCDVKAILVKLSLAIRFFFDQNKNKGKRKKGTNGAEGKMWLEILVGK